MMAVSMFAVTVPAMAANVSSPTAATLQEGKAQTTVNGETRQGVTYSVNAQTKKSVTFTYNGEGTFKSWTDNLSALGLAEGTDYTKVLNADGSQTITFISQKAITSWNNGSVVVNAVVEFADDTTEATEKTQQRLQSLRRILLQNLLQQVHQVLLWQVQLQQQVQVLQF